MSDAGRSEHSSHLRSAWFVLLYVAQVYGRVSIYLSSLICSIKKHTDSYSRNSIIYSLLLHSNMLVGKCLLTSGNSTARYNAMEVSACFNKCLNGVR